MITTGRHAFRALKCSKAISAYFQKINLALVTQPCIRSITTEEVKEETEISVREKIQLSRPSVTKWKRPPFVKNLFLGKFDTELLAFPEILDKEHLTELETSVLAINDVYKEKINSFKIDEERRIPEDVLQEFKEMGLFGRLIPARYGGLELTYTEYARLNEAVGLDWSIGAVLGMHELFGAQALLAVGTEAQKIKYLPDLASGKKVATLCCFESNSGSDPTSVDTTVTLSVDGTSYIINGTKTWVTNVNAANLYIVLARFPKRLAEEDPELAMFLVNKDAEGVKVFNTFDNTSLCGTGVGSVQFDEVIVPADCILGKPGLGHALLNRLHEMCRFGMSCLTIGALKTFVDHATEYVINTDRMGKALADYLLVRKRLSKITQMLYVMESISYFTAAIYDSTVNPDCALESAIMKVYNSEGTLYCLSELMKVVGAVSLSRNQQLERFYRDAQGLQIFDTSNDIARLFIGLSGCKYVGDHRTKEIEKYRNPFFFPWERVKFLVRYRRIGKEKFNYKQDLAGHLHPSLLPQGNYLEECVQMLEASVEFVLQSHGRQVTEAELDPVKLADIAIDVYAMAAVLSRTSRSYCIGLHNNDHELKIAVAFCHEAKERVQKTFKDIISGVCVNNDGILAMVGEQVVDCRGFFPEHPLKHD